MSSFHRATNYAQCWVLIGWHVHVDQTSDAILNAIWIRSEMNMIKIITMLNKYIKMMYWTSFNELTK